MIHINMRSVAQGEVIVNATKLIGYSGIWSLRKVNQYILGGLEIDREHLRIMKWVPQLAVMEHLPIAIAIIHGGMNGVHKAMHLLWCSSLFHL